MTFLKKRFGIYEKLFFVYKLSCAVCFVIFINSYKATVYAIYKKHPIKTGVSRTSSGIKNKKMIARKFRP